MEKNLGNENSEKVMIKKTYKHDKPIERGNNAYHQMMN